MRLRIKSFLLLCVCLLAWPGGCSSRSGHEPSQAREKPQRLEREFSGGPVTLLVRVDKAAPTLADQITLELELIVEAGFEAEFPQYLPEDFEGFSVTDVQGPDMVVGPQRSKENIRKGQVPVARGVRRLTLEPNRSGDLTIAPLEVFFRRRGEKEENSFETEEFVIHVAPLKDIGALDFKPHEIFKAPPAEGPSRPWWYAALGLGVISGAAVAGFFFLRRRTKAPPPPPPPDEVAWEALRRLVALDLISKGEIERFYVLLSSILRQYIEGRFGVRAPERTTQEFLEEASRSPELGRHRDRLKEFLELSDMVKFARYEPDPPVIQASFDTVKRFIEETAEG